MSDGTLDDRYLEWLYKQIGAVRSQNPRRSYWHLAKQLYTTAFDWSVPNDDNRVEDGCELRYEFLDELGIHDAEPTWISIQCSLLEMFIALARRASFESDGEPGDWFWKFMHNLDLKGYTDAVYSKTVEKEVAQALLIFVDRQYAPDGSNGGLFPLQVPRHDQRRVELWYQLSAYLLEGNYLEDGSRD